jgi:hypothetical protein
VNGDRFNMEIRKTGKDLQSQSPADYGDFPGGANFKVS